MQKKIGLLTTVFASMVLLCFIIASVAALVDGKILFVSIGVFIVGMLLVFAQVRYIKNDIERYLLYMGQKVGELQTDAIVNHPLPVIVVSESNEIVWYNKKFEELVPNGRSHLFGQKVSEIVGDVEFRQSVPEKGFNIRFNDRSFSMHVNHYNLQSNGMCALYLVDDTDFKHYTDQYFKTRASIMFIMVDNYDELVQSAKENDTTQVLSDIDYQISQFAEKYKGILYKLEKDRYTVLFEDQYMQQIIQGRFEILDTIRAVDVSDRVPSTLSIGIGRAAQSVQEADEMARQALDMALGRGGDQAAVRTKNGYDFFGGLSKGVEKRTKVKTRIVATALSELIASSENVILMGHRFADLDCFGAAIALHKAVTLMGKQAWIAIDPEKNLVGALYEQMAENGYRDYLVSPDLLVDKITNSTLLIIVDTHSKLILESSEIYEKCKSIAIIDHHRKLVDHIDNATIFYHEPYASSASEMVTELIQYFSGNIKITRLEAEALLSGIMLDTKNFVIKAGVRTFEAAAYLRRIGADTMEVRKLFSSSMDAYQRRTRLVASAEIYRGCAVASTNSTVDDITIVAPQAADELLNISDVDASFVVYELGKQVSISARSLGEMNVQVVMEHLGGGGHLTMAGAQFAEGVSIESARQKLLEAIDNYRDHTN